MGQWYHVHSQNGVTHVVVSGLNAQHRQHITETLALEIIDKEVEVKMHQKGVGVVQTYIFSCYIKNAVYPSETFSKLISLLKAEGFQVIGMVY